MQEILIQTWAIDSCFYSVLRQLSIFAPPMKLVLLLEDAAPKMGSYTIQHKWGGQDFQLSHIDT